MKTPLTAVLALTLAASLAACDLNSNTTPIPDTGDTLADVSADDLTTVSRTVYVSPVQARVLGLTSQAASPFAGPLAVTLAVKVAKAGTQFAGSKRASVTWKTNLGTVATSYNLALYVTDASGGREADPLVKKAKEKAGTLDQILKAGVKTISSTRSTPYGLWVAPPYCAVLSYRSAGAGQTFEATAVAPLTVCEPGALLPVALRPPSAPVAPSPSLPAPAPTLDNVQLSTWFDAASPVNARASLWGFPVEASYSAAYTFRDAEECGAGDRYGTYGSGQWNDFSEVAGVADLRLPIDAQSMIGGQGLAYTFVVTLGGQVKTLSGVLCYRPAAQGEAM